MEKYKTAEMLEMMNREKRLTINALFVSRALAMACAASTPTVFPSNLRACKPSKSWISFTISSTAEIQTIILKQVTHKKKIIKAKPLDYFSD